MANKDYMRELWKKRRKERDAFANWAQLMAISLSQFEYEGLPETVPAEFLEASLLVNGTVAIGKIRELGEASEIYCAAGSYNGDYNGYLPDSYTAAVLGLGEISGKWYGEAADIVVGCNNLLRVPDFDITTTAEAMTESDLSEAINVIFSRFIRIPYADDETQKQKLIEAIENIIKGNIKAVASRNAVQEYLTNGATSAKADKFLDLVDVDKVRDLQYLNQYRDNILKRFLMRRGYMFNVTSKLAQQTTDEIHGSDTVAMVYPYHQLRCRESFIEECNERFGWSANVKLNPLVDVTLQAVLAPPKEEQQPDAQSEEEQADAQSEAEEQNDEQTDEGGGEE